MQTDVADLSAKGMLVHPGDHFKGRFEVERKFRLDDLADVRNKLNQNGATAFTLGNSETDFFFDLPDGRLASNNQFQTLRHMMPSDRILWISKGPAEDECVAMDLAEFDKAAAMLGSLGFVETMRISKKRDIYFIEEFHVTLDEVDGLGKFVELAVMTDDPNALSALRTKIQHMAERLGLLSLVEEMRSYRQMLTE
ncbi:MAG: class IV adenylate cyclase [Hyphomicrobiales bacterium]|nr:class IV adenylate cyclase [Hyphomicrobiales bacterium]MCP4997759.1 class IV adenylate cyclase [Hyphomicrobiales bacterium]